MEHDHIRVEVDGAVVAITLNRPDKLNAFTAEMLYDFRTALERVAGDDAARAVVITGAGRGFCAGQDLSDRVVAPGDAPPDLGESLDSRYNPIVRIIRSMPKPVVVGVNGVAAGAGASLALSGDVVIAARSARFIQSFSRIGLLPDSGGTYFLPRAVGLPRALGLALTGRSLTAEEAHAWGLVWQVVDDADLSATMGEMAAAFAAGPTAGYAKIKEAMGVSLQHTLHQQLDLERDLQRAAGRSRDYGEGVAAFMAKREPRFEGR